VICNPQQLKSFVAAADELHFTRAAGRVHMSQQGLSTHIARLERQLSVTLFQRGPRGVVLTSAGQALLPRARAVLGALDELGRAADAAKAIGGPGLLRIGGIAVGSDLIPAALRAFASAHPNVRLDLRTGAWRSPTRGLLDDATQVAFAAPPLETPGLQFRTVRREPRVLVLPAAHALSRQNSTAVLLDDLLDDLWMEAPGADPASSDYWTAVPERGGAARVGAEISGPPDFFESIRAGLIVGMCPISIAPKDGAGIAVRRMLPHIDCDFAVCWRRGDDNPLVHSFVTIAAATAAAMDANEALISSPRSGRPERDDQPAGGPRRYTGDAGQARDRADAPRAPAAATP
jgi:DNA-binding transcriptional LysR family regulator